MLKKIKKAQMTTLEISSKDISIAEVEKRHHISSNVRTRMSALWLLGNNYSRKEVAKICCICLKSVKNYIAIYRKSGIKGLLTLHYKVKISQLSSKRSTLEAEFTARPPRSVKEANKRIVNLTKIALSNSQIRRFLLSIGMKPLRTGSIPAKANVERQNTFLDHTLKVRIEDAKKGNSHLFFMDASHYILSPYAAVLWCFSRIFIRATAGRNRINVLGALNAITLKLETIINTDYINAFTIQDMLNLLHKNYSDKPIYIILDNARYQHCAFVIDLAAQLGIHLVFLPPYSPNLNLIERLWKFIKKNAIYNQYFETAAIFHQAVREACFKVSNDKEWKEDLKSLLTLNFQSFDNLNIINCNN